MAETFGKADMKDCVIIGGGPAGLTAALYLALKYADDPEAGLVANANLGGDNCHRGAVLGALLGAATGTGGFPLRWRSGLAAAGDLLGGA